MKIVSLLGLSLTLCASPSLAQQKQVYIPDTLKSVNLADPQSQWAWSRSAQTENLVFFWQKGFGYDPYTAPELDGNKMSFDLGNLLVRLEDFYRFYRDSLKFTLPGSLSDKYKMMVMLDYSLEGTAYGGTYDDFIGALWVSPLRIQDRKLNCLAHELGHSFQLQIMADKTGEAWGGSGFFEMTSQWMLWLVNPDWLTDENYHFEAFKKLTHKGFLSLDNIYHSPFVIEWWAERHGIASIADLYRDGRVGEDPAMTYMRRYGLSQSQFCDDMFTCYQHLLNFDFSHARKETRSYALSFSTPMDTLAGGWLTPDTACVPENYGFNAIKLPVPTSGQKVTAQFKSLSVKCPTAGYRYSFVAVTADDEPIYGTASQSLNGRVSFTAPANRPLKALYLLVMGAPTTHQQDPASRLFPYKVKISTSRK